MAASTQVSVSLYWKGPTHWTGNKTTTIAQVVALNLANSKVFANLPEGSDINYRQIKLGDKDVDSVFLKIEELSLLTITIFCGTLIHTNVEQKNAVDVIVRLPKRFEAGQFYKLIILADQDNCYVCSAKLAKA